MFAALMEIEQQLEYKYELRGLLFIIIMMNEIETLVWQGDEIFFAEK